MAWRTCDVVELRLEQPEHAVDRAGRDRAVALCLDWTAFMIFSPRGGVSATLSES